MEINKPVLVIITLVITLTVFFLFVLPKYQESMSLETELAKKRSQYDGRVDYYLRLSDILKDIEQKQDILDKIDSALPNSFTLAPIVYFFQKKAIESKLNLKSVTFSQPESFQNAPSGTSSNREIKDVAFEVDLFGSYQALKSFLYSLEKSARLFEVNSIVFSSDQISNLNRLQRASQSYDFTMEIQTHTY